MLLLADDAVDQVLDRLARHHLVGGAFEAKPDGEILGIVTVAALQDAEHAQPRLAVRARVDLGHAISRPRDRAFSG
jgi:hypothetical protein